MNKLKAEIVMVKRISGRIGISKKAADGSGKFDIDIVLGMPEVIGAFLASGLIYSSAAVLDEILSTDKLYEGGIA